MLREWDALRAKREAEPAAEVVVRPTAPAKAL
jgi:hypothetical protein